MKKITILCFVLACTTMVFGQEFIPGFDTFSHSKPAYLTLNDGRMLEAEIEDIDRKKGLIEAITLRSKTNKMTTILPGEIKTMYLPATEMTRLDNQRNTITNVRKLQNAGVNMDIIKKGYAYFEKSTVIIKGESLTLLLQLVNPTFSQKIKVYFDPRASKTLSLSARVMTVAGGIDKSYYVRVGDGNAYRLEKDDYQNEFRHLFADCPVFVQKYGRSQSPVWRDFAKHVAEYHQLCGN